MTDAQLETGSQTVSTIRLAALPIDDDARDHADSALPFEMIAAGADALEACRNDLDNYVAGQTPDWDSGMIAVSIYRAMTAAGVSIAQQQDASASLTALSIIEQWSKPSFMKLRAGEMTAGEQRTVQAVLAGVCAAIKAATSAAPGTDRTVLAERMACTSLARTEPGTADERRLLEHAQSLNPHGIGTKCATSEDIEVAKDMVAKGWLTETPEGRFITDAGRRALNLASGVGLTRRD
jgi:hypothetical protein